MEIKDRVLAYKDEMLARLADLVSYDSVSEYNENDKVNPFGQTCTDVLNRALQYGKQDGFDAVNVDNMCGYIQTGSGDHIIGIMGHLDIVPCGEGWDSDPLKMIEKEGIIYGRGVSDDKGAVVASMYALKILKDMNVPMNKRIRLIMGINEEKGSRCLEHYVQKCGHVQYGFTPDGNFPGIYGEKGMCSATYHGVSDAIIDIHGGTVSNAVCFKVEAKVKKDNIDIDKLDQYFKRSPLSSYNIKESSDSLDILCVGKAAHASLPQLGVNAISYLMLGLKASGLKDNFVDYYCDTFADETNGLKAGAYCHDEYGELTVNTGVINKVNDEIVGTIDCRVPVKCDPNYVANKLKASSKYGVSVDIGSVVKSLFYDPNSPFIQALVSSYQQVTNDYDSKPEVIGGGTYAKEINNTIAFGCAFPGKDNYHIHDVNEKCPVDELLKQVEIYVVAIMKLLEL